MLASLGAEAVSTRDRHDCPGCRGTRIQMIVHDLSRVVLRCMQCGCWFGVPPATWLPRVSEAPTVLSQPA
jgi:hypothetical protein